MDISGQITRLLAEAGDGRRDALNDLLPLVYAELRELASRQMRGERQEHTLQPTALVHEAYMKLIDINQVEYNDRIHFFSVAARAMRRILVNHGKHRGRQKRGGDHDRVPLHDDVAEAHTPDVDFVALDDALGKLEEISERRAKVVELRYFAGLSVEETAELLAVGVTTVKDEWALAKAWLMREMSQADE